MMLAPSGQGWFTTSVQLLAATHMLGITACPGPLGMALLGNPPHLHVPV